MCGSIIGYNSRTTDAFRYTRDDSTINDAYVDGVSVTHGKSHRQHVWTFAADYRVSCPCSSTPAGNIPEFVGLNYFCEFNTNQRLWDGQGCNDANCCVGPPWFTTDLVTSTTDDIEIRICLDSPTSNEDVSIEKIELYIQ